MQLFTNLSGAEMCRLFLCGFFRFYTSRLFLLSREDFLRLASEPYLLGVILYLIHNNEQKRHHEQIRNRAEKSGVHKRHQLHSDIRDKDKLICQRVAARKIDDSRNEHIAVCRDTDYAEAADNLERRRMIPAKRSLCGMVDVSVSEIAESPAEKRIGTEISTARCMSLTLISLSSIWRSLKIISRKEIDKIPEEHEKQNYSDGDYD